MKKAIFIFIYIIGTTWCMAANDNATMECIYRLTFLSDTTNQMNKEAIMVLRIGKNKSLFYSEAAFERDSLLRNKFSNIAASRAINDSIKNKYGKINASYYILKEFQTKKLEFIDKVIQTYEYTENLQEFTWKLTNEKKKIGEYECQKATCSFGGRNYEAWFAPDIPVSDGPWKFNGLPGLVLEVYDLQHHYEFTFLGMRDCSGKIAIPVDDYVKTTKKAFLNIKQRSIDDPKAFLTGIAASLGIKGDNKLPQKRIFYATMERIESLKD